MGREARGEVWTNASLAGVGREAASRGVVDADGVVERREAAGGPGEKGPPPFQKGQKEQGVFHPPPWQSHGEGGPPPWWMLGSSQEALTALAMGARVAVVLHLNGGDLDLTMEETSEGG